jgi:hypothetical protein
MTVEEQLMKEIQDLPLEAQAFRRESERVFSAEKALFPLRCCTG